MPIIVSSFKVPNADHLVNLAAARTPTFDLTETTQVNGPPRAITHTFNIWPLKYVDTLYSGFFEVETNPKQFLTSNPLNNLGMHRIADFEPDPIMQHHWLTSQMLFWLNENKSPHPKSSRSCHINI